MKFKILKEEKNINKTFIFPKSQEAINYYWKNEDAKIEKIDIEKLVIDNNLLNDYDLESYIHPSWDYKKAKEFSIDINKINKMSLSEIPYARRNKDGKLVLGDGRHRIRALYNDGYKYVILPVITNKTK